MLLELFLFVRKKDEILDLRAEFIIFPGLTGINYIPRSSLGPFILCAGTHWSN